MTHPYRTASDRSDEPGDPRYHVSRAARRLVKVARFLRLAWYWERKTEQHRKRIRRRLEALLLSTEERSYRLDSVDATVEKLRLLLPDLDLSVLPVGALVPLSPDGAHAYVTKMHETLTLTSKYPSGRRPPKTPPHPLPPPKKSSE